MTSESFRFTTDGLRHWWACHGGFYSWRPTAWRWRLAHLIEKHHEVEMIDPSGHHCLIDRGCVAMIDELWNAGIRTYACCEGYRLSPVPSGYVATVDAQMDRARSIVSKYVSITEEDGGCFRWAA